MDREHTNIERELKTYLLQTALADRKPITDIKPDDSFMNNGILDSLSLLDFVLFIERRYHIKIPGEEIVPENFDSLAAVTAYLYRKLERRE